MAGVSGRFTGRAIYTSATTYWLKQPVPPEVQIGGEILGVLCILTSVSATVAVYDVATSLSATVSSQIFNGSLPPATNQPVFLDIPADFANGCYVIGAGGIATRLTWFVR